MNGNTNTDLTCIILGGGEQHRFDDSLPRPLQPLRGMPMVGHVLSAVERLRPSTIGIVAKSGDLKIFTGARATMVIQEKTQGSGDALYRAKHIIEQAVDDILIVYGDRPFLKTETLARLIETRQESGLDCALLSVIMQRPEGNGRVIRDERGNVTGAGRDCDLPWAKTRIQEVVAGAYALKKEAVLASFDHFNAGTAPWFYMTDIVNWLAEKRQAIALKVPDAREVLGFYSVNDLVAAEA